MDDSYIEIIKTSHDTSDSSSFILHCDTKSIVYLTDTGMIHQKYHKYLINREVYLLESNHDVEMEMHGSKDEMTKIRNIGDSGHLSNEECAMYLNRFIGPNTKYICLMHISEHDNTYDLAYKVNREAIDCKIPIILSYKEKPSEIIEL